MTTPPGDPEPTNEFTPFDSLAQYLQDFVDNSVWADTGREAARYILNMGWTHPDLGDPA